MEKTKKIIDTTLEEYTKEVVETGIFKAEDFRQQYYDTICKIIAENYIGISERMYKLIPDLHYWIYKHIESLGYKVVFNEYEIVTNRMEKITIKAY